MSITDVGTLRVILKSDVARFNRDMTRSDRKFKTVTSRMERNAKRASSSISSSMKLIGASIAGVGVARIGSSGFKKIISDSANFGAAMLDVKVVAGATAEQFQLMETRALELGNSTMFTAAQVGDAMKFMAMAGMDANQILTGISPTLSLAAASGMDLGQAADIATNILTGFGKTASELEGAVDVLVKTFTSSNTNLMQLGDAFKYAGGIAKSAGVDFHTVAAALGLLGNAGFQGEMAGTALRGAFTKMLNITPQVKREMDALGLSFVDSNGRLLKLSEIIKRLKPHLHDAGLFMRIFGQRAGPGMMALVRQGSGALVDLEEKLKSSGGAAKEVADVKMKGLKGSFREATSAAEGLSIAIGDTGLSKSFEGLTRSIAKGMRGLTSWIRIASQENNKLSEIDLQKKINDMRDSLAEVNSEQGVGRIASLGIGRNDREKLQKQIEEAEEELAKRRRDAKNKWAVEYNDKIAKNDEQNKDKGKVKKVSKRGGGKGQRSQADILAEFKSSIDETTRSLQLENEALNQSALQADMARTKFELLNQAKQSGLEITPDVIAFIDKQAKAQAQLNQKNEEGLAKKEELISFQQRLSDTFVGLIDGTHNFKDAVRELTSELARMMANKAITSFLGKAFGTSGGGSNIASTIIGAFGFANGGIMTSRGPAKLPVNTYANGGVARSPQIAVYGEGKSRAEAYVPLPDGRSIPAVVKFKDTPKSSGSNQTVFNIDARGAEVGVEQKIKQVLIDYDSTRRQNLPSEIRDAQQRGHI